MGGQEDEHVVTAVRYAGIRIAFHPHPPGAIVSAMESSEHQHILHAVADFVGSLREQGQIAVDTPELRLFVQGRLLEGLRAEVDEAVREEFVTAEEAEEADELFAADDVRELDERLRILLPQYDERVSLLLEGIGDALANR